MDRCIYCGSNQNLTDDHIPSKCLFPESHSKTNLITVPSCQSCNKSYSRDEEYFRNFVTFLTVDKSKRADELFLSKIKRSMIRSPAIRQAALDKMKMVNLISNDGLCLGEKTKVAITEEDWARHHRVLDKYIKGLLYKELGAILPEEYQIKHFMGNDKLLKIVQQMKKWDFNNKDVFFYGYNELPGSYKSIWTTVYFNQAFFVSFVTPIGYVENLLKRRKGS